MTDSFGDGWNGNVMTVKDCDGNVLQTNITLTETESARWVSVCLPISDGLIIEVDGGIWDSEIGWTLMDDQGDAVLVGGAPFVGDYNCCEHC